MCTNAAMLPVFELRLNSYSYIRKLVSYIYIRILIVVSWLCPRLIPSLLYKVLKSCNSTNGFKKRKKSSVTFLMVSNILSQLKFISNSYHNNVVPKKATCLEKNGISWPHFLSITFSIIGMKYYGKCQ